MTDQPAIGERVEDDEARYRLPRTIAPHRYDLVLEPDLEAATFAGSEAVTLEVVEPVDEVVLNAIDLDVGPGRLEGPGGTLEISTIRLDPEVRQFPSLNGAEIVLSSEEARRVDGGRLQGGERRQTDLDHDRKFVMEAHARNLSGTSRVRAGKESNTRAMHRRSHGPNATPLVSNWISGPNCPPEPPFLSNDSCWT